MQIRSVGGVLKAGSLVAYPDSCKQEVSWPAVDIHEIVGIFLASLALCQPNTIVEIKVQGRFDHPVEGTHRHLRKGPVVRIGQKCVDVCLRFDQFALLLVPLALGGVGV